MKKGLPKQLIANTLNTRFRRVERTHSNTKAIPRLHVSSLIKSGSQDAYCSREFALRYFEPTEAAGGGIPPKFQLLYDVGHFYGDYVVREFLRRNLEWAKYAWGDWRCLCGKVTRKEQCMPQKVVCKGCGTKCQTYVEIDLFNPRKTVVGHADLIFNVDGYFYVYEFKSIDRADIVFDEITEPLGDHLLQASNYYYMLKARGYKVSKQIRFVYVDRSMEDLYRKLPFKEVEGRAVKLRRLHRIYERADESHKAIKNKELPPRICDSITDSRAKQCSKAISCFSRIQKKIKHIQ